MKTPDDYLPQEGTLAYQIARENAVKDMAKWDCNRARNLVTKYPPASPAPHLTFEDAVKICTVSPQELDAIAKMEKDLMAKLERAHKIDRLKAELTIKAEELRQAQLAEAYEGVEEQEMTEADSEAFLKQLHADKLAEESSETRAYPQRLNPHP